MARTRALLAASLIAAPLTGVAALPAQPIDFASLSARYSVYPSIDTAQEQFAGVIPSGLATGAARERLTQLGMSCGPLRRSAFSCHYSTSVTVDALYIQPIVWTVVVREDHGLVRTTSVSVS